MRIASIATVAFALLCTMGAARAAEPLSGERVLASQLRLSARLIAELDGQPARRSPNIVISPASIAGILSLLDIGADTKMRGAVFTTLGLRRALGHEPATELAAFRATVAKATMDANMGAHRGKASFVLANAVVLDPQSRPYAKALAGMRATGAEVSVAPLTELSTIERINGWVAEKTRRLIPAILPAQPLPPGLTAVNALAFKGVWPLAFAKDNTRPRKFHARDADIELPMMSTTAAFHFRKQGRFAAVAMPYRGKRFVLMLVTTTDRAAKPGEFADVADWLGGAGFERKEVRLSLPRFTLEAGEELLDPLQAIGLAGGTDSPTAFEGLSAMPQQISRIVQKTYLRVDEEGTEAAAATGVITTLESAEPRKEIETLVVDRPFLFGLRDTRSGLLLMSGYIGRPSTGTAAAREDSTRQFATLPSNRVKE